MNLGQQQHSSLRKSTDRLDQKLVSRVQKGDRAAFDLLLVKYQNKVASIISRFVNTQADIEDLTQDVFIKAYRAIHTFRAESSFYTWLYRIAINHSKSFLQGNKRKNMLQSQPLNDMDRVRANQFLNTETPESLLCASELMGNIERVLSSMSGDMSVALMLREFDGLSYEEIATVMECPVGTVRSRIFRARELLDSSIRQQTCTN